MDPTDRVDKMIAPALEGMGYDLVRVQLTGDGKRRQLQVMAERHDGAAMTVEDCAAISRMVSALLDAEDPIAGSYLLEVSSPGIDRPLTRPRDFERFSGHVARIELRSTIDGRRRYRGRLQGIEDGLVRLEADGESVALPVDEIAKAKLIMTDELLAAFEGAAPEAPRGRHGGG